MAFQHNAGWGGERGQLVSASAFPVSPKVTTSHRSQGEECIAVSLVLCHCEGS